MIFAPFKIPATIVAIVPSTLSFDGKFNTSPINAFLLGPINIGNPKSSNSLSLFKSVKL